MAPTLSASLKDWFLGENVALSEYLCCIRCSLGLPVDSNTSTLTQTVQLEKCHNHEILG